MSEKHSNLLNNLKNAQLLLNNGKTSVYNTGKKLAFEYHKRKGHRNFVPGLIIDFGRKFLNARQPSLCHVRRIYKKAMELRTVLNVNSKTSPGNSFRSRHVRTPRNVAKVVQ